MIALFDLDHTLIPFDSGSTFTRFLIERGVLDSGFEEGYLDYAHQYAAGTLDITALHRYTVGALRKHSRERIAQWAADFEAAMAHRIPQASVDLVARHCRAGHRCALVTATTRFIVEPFARLLGVPDVLATEPALAADGHYSGEVAGPPCFRTGKLLHVDAWLVRECGIASLAQAQRSWFYSDSINDLPLLEAVTDPVAVRPDAPLEAHARARGWPVLADELAALAFAGTIAYA
jgi:HAD superfamily hydrolase (TIGR01490 family)